jgi:Kef-type K+ transport system membrane component KefB
MPTARGRITISRLLMLGALVSVGLWLCPDGVWAGGSEGHDSTLIASIGISILAATVLAFLSHAAKQPLLLAYIAAGVLIGPQIGLIILLFMIGLEIDVKKLKEAGTSLLLAGVAQFLLCTAFGVGFFRWLGYGLGPGTYDALYLACCCALSSTHTRVPSMVGEEMASSSSILTLRCTANWMPMGSK